MRQIADPLVPLELYSGAAESIEAGDAASLDYAVATQLVHAIGEAAFSDLLLNAVAAFCPIDVLGVNVFNYDLTQRPIAFASQARSGQLDRINDVYESLRLCDVDPNVHWLRSTPADLNSPLFFRISRADVPNATYRREIFERFDMVERLSFVHRFKDRWIVLKMLRGAQTGYASGAEIANLRANAEFLLGLVGWHVLVTLHHEAFASANAVESFERLLAKQRLGLSRREMQTCARVLVGMTNLDIGDALNVKESTIRTLRRRAYSKLGIAGVHELFMICMRQLQTDL